MTTHPLLGTAADTGDAVSVAGRAIAREDLEAAAAGVARRVAGGPAVAIHASASLETVVAIVGCLQAGVPFVPVAPDAGPLERDHVLRDSGAALLLGGPEGVAIDVGDRAQPPSAEPAGPTTACILYTSGTTGLP